MKKFLAYPVVVFLLLFSLQTASFATDTFVIDGHSDNSSISTNPNLSDAAGSEADLISSIKADPSATANYQAIATVYATAKLSGYKVFVDGDLIDFSKYDNVQPVIVNGRTLVPIRAISEGMGANVDWDSATNTVTITQDSTVVKLTIDSTTAYINGVASTLDVPAALIGGRTMVPLRFVGTALGEQVGWYPSGNIGVIALYN